MHIRIYEYIFIYIYTYIRLKQSILGQECECDSRTLYIQSDIREYYYHTLNYYFHSFNDVNIYKYTSEYI